jgi:CIC family chloride channel protein
MGDEVLFSFTITEAFKITNIPWYLILGMLSGLVSLFFSRMTLFLEKSYDRITNIYLRLILGGIVLGVLYLCFPPFNGEGYETIMLHVAGIQMSFRMYPFFIISETVLPEY